MIRILHFSDVHIEGPIRGTDALEWTNKRAVAWVAHHLVRRRRFRDAANKVQALARFAREQSVDLVICTGDYTALGTEPELSMARQAMAPFTDARLGFITLPGNHDVYLPRAVRDRRFERHFGDLLRSDRPDLATDGVWPMVRFPADGLAVITVNSVRPNPQLWRSSGRIPDAQLEGLRLASRDPEVRNRFVVVATHHAPRLASGRPDHFWHGLVNARALGAALSGLRAGMLLHGHVHRCFHLGPDVFGVPVFGAGSATHAGHEGLWIYELRDDRVAAFRGGLRDGRYAVVAPPIETRRTPGSAALPRMTPASSR